MTINCDTPSYVLGQSSTAELRLELLNEITSSNFLEATKLLPNKNVRILIIGCGSGHLEAMLSKTFSDSHFVGIDVSAKRIEEAKTRTGALKCNNTYEYMQADLTTLMITELKPCDILISRFVLSHLSEPLKEFDRFLSLVKPGGFICLEELMSDSTEYFCNTENVGYRSFMKMVDAQIQAQKSSFTIGAKLLSELTQRPGKVIYTRLGQAILRSARHKSILRLGLEEIKPLILEQLNEEKVNETISSLRQFEENKDAFGLYSRFITIVAQTPEE